MTTLQDKKELQEKALLLQQEIVINAKNARKSAIALYREAIQKQVPEVRYVALQCILVSFMHYRVVSKQSQKWFNLTKRLLPAIPPSQAGYFHILLMNYYTTLDNKELAEQSYINAITIFEQCGDVPPHIYAQGAHFYWEYEKLEKGWELLCKAEKLQLHAFLNCKNEVEKTKVTSQLLYIYSLTINYFLHIGNNFASEKYCHLAIELTNTSHPLRARMLLLLINILHESNRIGECWQCINEAYLIYQHTKQPLIGMDIEVAKSLLYVHEQRYKEALHHINKAYKLAKHSKEQLLRLRPNIIKAEILFALGEVEQARTIIDEIEEFSKTTTKHIPKRFFLIGAQVYEHIGDSAKEIYYRKLFMERVVNFSQMQLQHKFHVIRERELGTFGHDELVAKHSLPTQKHVPPPQLKEFPPSAPNAFRPFDVLTSNEYLNAIRSTLVDLLYNADTLNHKTIKAKIKSVQQLIETNYNEQDMLFAVEREIQHVHKDFIEKLSFMYPSLSHTEIRVCLLLRLNLNTHQIAAMMNISPATVFTHRKNIRKKMGITRANSLSILLMQLSGLRVEG